MSLELVKILCECCGGVSEVTIFKDFPLECVHCGSTGVEIIEKIKDDKNNNLNKDIFVEDKKKKRKK